VLGRVDIESPWGGGAHLGVDEAVEPLIKGVVFGRCRPRDSGKGEREDRDKDGN
jgi:hypothetical protein